MMTVSSKEEKRRLRYKGVGLIRRRMTGEDFSHYDFSDSTIEDVEFVSADLTEASFKNCVLKDVDFSHAILTGADFSDSTLQGVVNFTRARVDGAMFENVEFLDAEGVIGAEFLLDDDQRGVGSQQASAVSEQALQPVIRHLPDSTVIDARATTDWANVLDSSPISFGVNDAAVNTDLVEVIRDVTNILLPNHEYFTVALLMMGVNERDEPTRSRIELRLAITNDGMFRCDLDGLNGFTPELTSKKRLLLKTMGWNGPAIDARIPTYHRDFSSNTPSRVLSEFFAQTVAAFQVMGYAGIPADFNPVYKHEQKPIKLAVTGWADRNSYSFG